MSTANSTTRVTELDFITIKNNLKTFLRNQSEFQDYDFDGAGLSVLLDILAYNTHYMGYYLNMAGNEMFLDTAQLRNSVISHAKNLNYFPKSPMGALVKANVTVTPSISETPNVNILTLEKYTKFLARDVDGVNFPFVALYSNTASKNNSSFAFNNIMLKQGEVVTLQYQMDATNTKRRFDIPSSNVDTSTLMVTVQESSSNTSTVQYNISEDITEVKANTPVYFIEENNSQQYSIYFGDDVIGKKPKNGNIITVTYLETYGSVANSISVFYLSDSIGGLYNDNVIISAASSSYGGTDKETVDQIRFRAPYFYTAQNRAVTKNDYETLITKDYTNIDAVSVWGGEDNDPPVYGKVYLALKTKGNYALTNLEKEQIKDSLIRTRNVVTVTPEIVDPEYVYILIKGRVNYNPTLTSLSSSELNAFVKASVLDYNEAELNSFNSTFRKSKLQTYIDNAEKSITASDIDVYVQYRVQLDTTQTKSYSIPLNLPLQKGDFYNKMFTSPEVQSFDLNGVSRNIYFEEVPASATGVESIEILDAGINYITIPSVTITGDGSGATAVAVVRNGRISAINITNRGSNYTRAEILISGTGSGGRAIARLEATIGAVRSFYYKTNGEKEIINSDAGTIDYESGLITLKAFRTTLGTPANRYYDTDVMTVNFPLEREIITPLRNRILSIDQNDPLAVQIEMVAES